MLDFDRRVNGITYYSGLGVASLVFIGMALLSNLAAFGDIIDTIIGLATILTAFVLFVYLVYLTKQRANDIGWHPSLVTIISVLTPVFLIIGLIPGQKTANQFGPVPKSGIVLKL